MIPEYTPLTAGSDIPASPVVDKDMVLGPAFQHPAVGDAADLDAGAVAGKHRQEVQGIDCGAAVILR